MSNITVGKWMFNIGGYDIWTGEEFDTNQKAIEEGRLEVIAENKINLERGFANEAIKSFDVGQIASVSPCGVDVDSILENIAENTGDEVGEVAEDYLMDVANEDAAELEEKLNEVLFTWMKKHNYEPNFFVMENIEEIEI
jgi:hypothetical protein